MSEDSNDNSPKPVGAEKIVPKPGRVGRPKLATVDGRAVDTRFVRPDLLKDHPPAIRTPVAKTAEEHLDSILSRCRAIKALDNPECPVDLGTLGDFFNITQYAPVSDFRIDEALTLAGLTKFPKDGFAPVAELESLIAFLIEKRSAVLSDSWFKELDNKYYRVLNYASGGVAVIPKYKTREGNTVHPMGSRHFTETALCSGWSVIVRQDDEGNDIWGNPHKAWLSDVAADFYQTEEFRPMSHDEWVAEDGDKEKPPLTPEKRRYASFNTWRGPAIKLTPGGFIKVEGEHPAQYMGVSAGFLKQGDQRLPQAFFPRIYDYLLTILSDGDRKVCEYLVRWLADVIQNPRRINGKVVLVFRSDGMGTGKTKFFRLLQRLVGAPYAYIFADPGALEDKFNTIEFLNRLIIAFDEMIVAGKAMPIYNNLVTGETIRAEQKNIQAITIKNYTRIVIFTNYDTPVPKKMDDRRSLVLRVSDVRKQDAVYFEELDKALDGKEFEAFYNFIAKVDVSRFIPVRDRPHSDEDDLQKLGGLSGVPGDLFEILDSGRLVYGHKDANGVAAAEWAFDSKRKAVRQSWFEELSAIGSINRYFVTTTPFNVVFAAKRPKQTPMKDHIFGLKIVGAFAQPNCPEKQKRCGGPDPIGGRWWPELHVARRLWELHFNGGKTWHWSNDLSKWQLEQPQ